MGIAYALASSRAAGQRLRSAGAGAASASLVAAQGGREG